MVRKARNYNGLTKAFDALILLQHNLEQAKNLEERRNFIQAYLKAGMQRELLDYLVTQVSKATQRGLTFNHNAEISIANQSVEFSVTEWVATFVNYLEEDSGEIAGKAYTTRNTCKWGAALCLSAAAVTGALLIVTHFGFMPFALTDPHAISAMVLGGIAFAVGAVCLGKFVSIVASRHAQKQRFESELSVFREHGGKFHLEGRVAEKRESLVLTSAQDQASRERSHSVMTDASYSSDSSGW